jgi:tetratricopeptide (TPR) repeat protein
MSMVTKQPIDGNEFLAVALPAIKSGDAEQLAAAIGQRWRPGDLCPLLDNANVDVRRVVAVTLGLVGDRRVLGCLTQALHDPDAQVNHMAEHGLWSIWMRLGSPQAAGPFRQGVAQLTQEAYDLAVASFQEATAIDPQFAEAHNQCAIAYFLLNDWEQSIACCRSAVALIHKHFGAIAGMGHGYTQLGQLQRALECYRTALQINPHMPAVARLIAELEERERGGNDSSGVFSTSRLQ